VAPTAMHEALRPQYRANLIAQLELVAAPAATQIAYLREHRFSSDELALDLNDLCLLASQAVELGLISTAVHDSLARLDEHFDAISGQQNAHLWTDDALKCSAEWRAARSTAEVCLSILRANG
jgi:hypothetical protein